MEKNDDLPNLKQIYDELWTDAKALAKDLQRNIAVTSYAAYATLVIAVISLITSLPQFVKVVLGVGDTFAYAIVALQIVGFSLMIFFSVILFRWYRALVKKYSRLISIQKKLE